MELGIQIGGALLALVFFVFLFLSVKTWKWFHVLATFLVMAATFTFCIYAALGSKTRRAWAEKYATEKQAVGQAKEARLRLINGDPNPSSGDPEPGLIELRGAYARATEGRSNVYRNCTIPAPFDGKSPVTVTIPAPRPVIPPGEEAAAPAATNVHAIAENSHVYVFLERPLSPASPEKYPVDYIGEFLVTGTTDSTVTLVPTLPPLTPSSTDAIHTWAIYEEIPADRQNYIQDLRDPDVVARAFRGAGFNLDEAAAQQENQRILRIIFPPARLGMADGSDEYKEFLRRFRFDGLPLSTINSTLANEGGPEFDPPPEETWAHIEFTQPEKFEVDSAQEDRITGAAGGDATVPDVFDSEGRAVSAELRQGGPTEIDLKVKELREGVFDNIPVEAPAAGDTERLGTAAALEAAGKAKIKAKVYVRKLIDFRHYFRHAYDSTRLLEQEKAELNREIARVQQATKIIDAQTKLAEEVRTRLNEDLKNFTAQLEKAQAHADQLEKDVAAKRAKIDQLIADIGGYETRLASFNRIMEDAVRRRAEAVSVESP